MSATFDFVRYAELLTRAYELTKRLREDRPDDPMEYVAAINEIAAIWIEAQRMLTEDSPTPGDIDEAHRLNQISWPVNTEPDPADPTTVEYANPNSAIAVAEKLDGYGVIELPDGTFRVWPIGSFGLPGATWYWRPTT